MEQDKDRYLHNLPGFIREKELTQSNWPMVLDSHVPSHSFSQASIDDAQVHGKHGAVFNMDGTGAVGLGYTAEGGCVSLHESLESCIWDTAALLAEKDGISVLDDNEFQERMTISLRLGLVKLKMHSKPSEVNADKSVEYASVDLLESLWEDDDGLRQGSTDEYNMLISEFQFDRRAYRKWIGANGIHAH
jgi:hypothetical protein